MKGSLFSTDFLKDSEDNLRLLEINTDTAIPSSALSLLDFSSFKAVLEANTITKVTVVYKVFQMDIVDILEEYLNVNYPSLVNSTDSMKMVIISTLQ